MQSNEESRFGARLKQHRNARELTQRELGRMLGVSQETITNYERGGRFPRPATLTAIARLFGLSLDELLGARNPEALPGKDAGGDAAVHQDFNGEHLLALLQREPMGRAFSFTSAWKSAFALPLSGIYEEALIPLLARVGQLWQQGELSIAEEHLLSEKVRELAILHASAEPAVESGPSGAGRRWMGLCAPGEKHELALFMYSLVLRQAGWNTWYLGTQVPLADLLSAIEARQPRVLGFSVTLAENTEALELYARQIRARFGARPALIVGGQGASHPSPGLAAIVDAFATSMTGGLALAERFAKVD